MTSVLGISGGAFYIRAQARAAMTLHEQGQRFDCYTGSSSGSIISFVAAVHGIPKMWAAAQNINPADAIKNSPYNDKGEIRDWVSIKAGLFGEMPVKQSVAPIISAIVSKRDFDLWRKTAGTADCFVLTADIENGCRKLWNLKFYSYELVLKIIEASCAMQGMVKPIEVGCFLNWDGGQFDHNPIHQLFEIEAGANIKHACAIWSRPNNWAVPFKDMKEAKAMALLMRMIEIDNVEKSNNDQSIFEAKCKERGIKPLQVFIERVLKHPYDSSTEGQAAAVKEGDLAAMTALSDWAKSP